MKPNTVAFLAFMAGMLLVGLSHYHSGVGTDWLRWAGAMLGTMIACIAYRAKR